MGGVGHQQPRLERPQPCDRAPGTARWNRQARNPTVEGAPQPTFGGARDHSGVTISHKARGKAQQERLATTPAGVGVDVNDWIGREVGHGVGGVGVAGRVGRGSAASEEEETSAQDISAGALSPGW